MNRQKMLDDAKEGASDSAPSIGLFIVSASALIAEACSMAKPDFLVFDMEASPADRALLTQMLQATSQSGVFQIARVSQLQTHAIEAALDAGARGVVVPKVSTVEEAKAVVSAARYPPLGRRGLNPIRCSGFFTQLPHYLATANNDILVGVQIETKLGLTNVRAIAAVPGIDLIFVGCGDLAAELGHIGNVEHPRVNRAIVEILSACKESGNIPGIFAYSPDLAARYSRMGYRFIAIGNEIKMMLDSLGPAVITARNNSFAQDENTRDIT